MIYKALLWVFMRLPLRAQEIAEWLISTKSAVRVAVIAFDEDGKVMLFQHRFHDPDRWQLPGGHMARRESLEETIARELKEEGGAVVETQNIVSTQFSRQWPSRMTVYYRARLNRLPEKSTSEVVSWRLFDTTDLPERLPRAQAWAIQQAARQIVDAPKGQR